MFRIVRVPVPIIVWKPKKEAAERPPQAPKKKSSGSEALYETLDEFNDIWTDLKRK
jgi:hypothetical protein